MNKAKMYAQLTSGLKIDDVGYCVDVFDLIMNQSADPDYLKCTLPIARQAVEDLSDSLPPEKELAETVITVYDTSVSMYRSMATSGDAETEANILMCREIVKHFQ